MAVDGDDEVVAVAVIVSGRVQGVSFRAGCRRRAHELGVEGWVRNDPDGTVSGRFEGEPGSVEALLAWCRHGPPGARVRRVVARSVQPRGERGGFRVEP